MQKHLPFVNLFFVLVLPVRCSLLFMIYANYKGISVQRNCVLVYIMAPGPFPQSRAFAGTLEQIRTLGVCLMSGREPHTPERRWTPRKLTHLRGAIFTW